MLFIRVGGKEMLLAITTFGSRVSPRFDCARSLLLVDIEKGESISRKQEAFKRAPAIKRASFLLNNGVKAIITGGILRCDYFALLDAGLEVHAGFMGEVEENLRRYLTGNLPRLGPGLHFSRKHGDGNRGRTFMQGR